MSQSLAFVAAACLAAPALAQTSATPESSATLDEVVIQASLLREQPLLQAPASLTVWHIALRLGFFVRDHRYVCFIYVCAAFVAYEPVPRPSVLSQYPESCWKPLKRGVIVPAGCLEFSTKL